MSSSEDDDLHPEYDLKKLGPGVRGKYHKRFHESTNVALIDSDLREEAVNDALAKYLRTVRGQPNNALNPTPEGLRRFGALRAAAQVTRTLGATGR